MSKQPQQSKAPAPHPTHHAGKAGSGSVHMPNNNQQTQGDRGTTVHVKVGGAFKGKFKSL